MKPKIITVTITLAGAFLVLSYWVLSLVGVGNIGDEADIGGGIILLAGYALVLGGIISLITVSLTGRHKN